jgi:hypothetical protein
VALRPPRISGQERERLCRLVVAADSREVASRVLDDVWSKLEGDMQDRITTLIYAAQAAVDGRNLGGVERALKDLAGHEAAATSDRQLREGPWHGRQRQG